MKKIFTLMALAATTLSMSAAAPELLFNMQPTQPGQTYETGYTTKVTEYPSMGITMTQYIQDADLFLKGIIGKETTIQLEATSQVQICCFGNCAMATEVTKSGQLTIIEEDSPFFMYWENGKIWTDGTNAIFNMLIEKTAMDTTGADPATLLTNVEVRVKAYYTESPNEYSEVTVKLLDKPASEVGGIAGVTGDDCFVRPVGGNILNYKVAAPTKLDLYSITGAMVMSRTINASGSVSLDNLPAGIYIYRAGRNSGKLIVK